MKQLLILILILYDDLSGMCMYVCLGSDITLVSQDANVHIYLSVSHYVVHNKSELKCDF